MPLFCLKVRGRRGQVHQPEIVANSKQRFGMSKEKVSMRQKVVVEVLNDALLGRDVEIDQDIAAKNNVDALHESHARVVQQVDAREVHLRFHFGIDVQFVAASDDRKSVV